MAGWASYGLVAAAMRWWLLAIGELLVHDRPEDRIAQPALVQAMQQRRCRPSALGGGFSGSASAAAGVW